MRNRSLSTGILLLALFLSVCGNVLAAALCPHMKQDHSCCYAKVTHGSPSHEMMGEMQMGDMQMTPAADQEIQEIEANALSQPDESCAHCIGHSQLPATPITMREASQTNYGMERDAPLTPLQPVPLTPSFVPSIILRQHAPPGATTAARHVLINVFRI